MVIVLYQNPRSIKVTRENDGAVQTAKAILYDGESAADALKNVLLEMARISEEGGLAK